MICETISISAESNILGEDSAARMEEFHAVEKDIRDHPSDGICLW